MIEEKPEDISIFKWNIKQKGKEKNHLWSLNKISVLVRLLARGSKSYWIGGFQKSGLGFGVEVEKRLSFCRSQESSLHTGRLVLALTEDGGSSRRKVFRVPTPTGPHYKETEDIELFRPSWLSSSGQVCLGRWTNISSGLCWGLLFGLLISFPWSSYSLQKWPWTTFTNERGLWVLTKDRKVISNLPLNMQFLSNCMLPQWPAHL